MYIRLFFIVGLWFGETGIQSYAQCLSRDSLYQRLSIVGSSSDNKQIIRELITLRKQCIQCRQTNDSVYAKLLHTIGRTYWYEGNLKLGGLYTRQAIAINQRRTSVANEPNLANSYYNLGQMHEQQSRYGEALIAFNQCAQIAAKYPVKQVWGSKALGRRAYILYLQGDYEAAIREADLGVRMAQQAKSKQSVADNLCQKAQALLRLDQPSAAKTELTQALSLLKATENSESIANIYSLLATVANQQHNHTAVVKYYRQAFTFNQQIGSRYGCVQTLSTLGEFYEKTLRQYNQALNTYKQALTYCDEATSRMVVLNDMGRVYYRQGRFEQAFTLYQQAFIAAPLGFTNQQSQVNPPISKLQTAFGKEYLLTLIQDKADTWLDYAKATNNNPQHLRHALETYQVADQMIDYMRWEHTADRSKLYWREKTRSIYERAIETCARLNDTEQAFRFFEKSRAVMLADKINELGARQQLSEAQLDNERALRQAVSTQQTELAKLTPDSVRYQPVRQELDTRQRQFEEFIKQLETTNPAYFQRKYDTTTTQLADLQRYLRQRKATFVSYFVGDSAVYVLSVEGNRARLQRLPESVPTFRKSVQTFMARLVNPGAISTQEDLKQFLRLGNGIYRHALAPLMPPAGRVIVSPDRFFVPFEALSASAGKPDYLVNQYAFDYAYSARLLLRKPDQPFEWRSLWDDGFLGFAPVRFAPRLGQVSLPGSDQALEAIGGRFRGANLFVGERANRQAFEQQAADARVIQLFTHAVADSTEREPLLYFADDTLRLSDLSNGEPLRAQLAVLGACQTGVGADQVGEGVFSLARGFAALGVPSIVSTLWSVQDQATYDLTESFHQYLDEGLPKDVALQYAKQNWLRNHHGADQSPNVWAGLILLGDAEPLSRSLHWSWLAAGIVLIVGGGRLWSWRRRVKRDRLILSRLA